MLRLSLLEHDLISVDFNCRLSNRQYGLRMCFVKVRVGKSEPIQTDTVNGRYLDPVSWKLVCIAIGRRTKYINQGETP